MYANRPKAVREQRTTGRHVDMVIIFSNPPISILNACEERCPKRIVKSTKRMRFYLCTITVFALSVKFKIECAICLC